MTKIAIKSYSKYMKLLNTCFVNTQNIRHNILNFKKQFEGTKICAVVKADAYGHGMEAVCNSIRDIVDFFGVADEREALKVRRISSKPILILGMIASENFSAVIKQNVSVSVSSLTYLKKMEQVAKKLNEKVRVHVKINTGMNRLGIKSVSAFKKILDYIKNSNHIVLEGVYTHFYNSTNKVDTEKQYQKFCPFLKKLGSKNIIIHASASNACFLDKKYAFNMVRLGLLMYGYSNFNPKFRLLPAMNIFATIVNITTVLHGDGVGYNHAYIANNAQKIATISMGYADGLMRANSNKGKVIVNGKFAKIVGNVCMDLCMIDITNIDCKVGDRVVILGESDNKNGLKIDANDIAQTTNTISYEILTNFRHDRMDYVVR